METVIRIRTPKKRPPLAKFTKEDFTKEEAVESDYRPIYKVDISNGDTLYIGLIYPNGKDKAMEYFCIGTSLDRVEKSINEY